MPRVRLALNASDIDDCGRLPHQAARHQASQAPFLLRQLRSPFTWRVPRMDPADVLASRREPGFGVGAGREFREPAGGGRQAADLAEQRGPREELRAAELLHEVAQEREAVRI